MTFFLWYDGEVHQNSLAENDGGQWLLAYAFESFEKFRDFAKTIMNKTFRRAYFESYMKREGFRIKS